MRELPTGTVTLLFTDVEGSTRLLRELGDGYGPALAEHRRLLRAAFATHGGVEVDTQGDAFFVAFGDAAAAGACAREAQEALRGGPLSVRMGLHTGAPTPTDEGYVGMDVHRAARIAAAAHGGQIVLSRATRDGLAQDAPVRDLDEHRLRDLAEPEWLFQLGDGEFPPLRSLAVTNLPVPATALVGRRAELAEAAALLERSRVLTVLGPGGVGKTRMAIALARDALGRYPNGAFFVPLATVREPALVLPAVARTLGVAEEPGRPLAESIAAHLEGRRVLLLLDNVEHVLDAAPDLSAVLAAAEGPTVLATSREPLRIRGEVEYELAPLGRDDAVELFLERAPAASRGDAVERLVARLDCLPLALELAAARTRLLPPERLVERLASRLDLPAGARDADDRQRTLRATIEWSHDLLDDDERRLFARLSVFVGGFTVAAAEAVADADLDGLESLLDKSLLRRGVASGEPRLSLLETIREFAAERLEASGEADDVLARHAAYFRTTLAASGPVPPERPSPAWVERVEVEHDNIDAALTWLDGRDVDGVAELAIAIALAWGASARIRETASWLDKALACTDDDLYTRVLGLASGTAFAQGEFERSRALAEEQLGRARAGDDASTVVVALGNLSSALSYLGEADEAERLLEEALELGASLDPRWRRMAGNLAAFAIARGDFERAEPLADDAVKLAREVDDVDTLIVSLANKGFVSLELGRPDAEELFAEALRLAVDARIVRAAAYAISGLAGVSADCGEHERAARLAASVDAICAETGLVFEPGEARRQAATVAAARDALGPAGFGAASAAGRALAFDDAVAEALSAGR